MAETLNLPEKLTLGGCPDTLTVCTLAHPQGQRESSMGALLGTIA